jgi:hypothetical protein
MSGRCDRPLDRTAISEDVDHSRPARMDAVRTLPIRLRPVAGEALDSWLEGLAHRTHSAFGDVLSAVGVDPYRGKGSNS